jgi:putative NADPH-quinone reductase
MSAIVVINGHPDGSSHRLCHALASAYQEAASAAGHTVTRIDVAELDFSLLRTQQEFEAGTPNADIKSAQNAIRMAHHIVLIYPLWLGTMPALLKGFLEQLFRPGFAFEYTSSKVPKKLLSGRSVRIVITMGMPALAYRWFFFAHSLRSLERNILKFAGLGPIHSTIFGGIETASDGKRKQWLGQMAELGKIAG